MPRQKDAAKEEAIFKAALRIALKDGFTGLTMSKLASMSGMAVGTLYIYFADKDQLLTALYRRIKQKHLALYLKDFQPQGPTLEGIRVIWHNAYHVALNHLDEVSFIEQFKASPYYTAAMQQETDAWFEPVFALLNRAKAEGLIKDLPNELLAAQIQGPIALIAAYSASGYLTNSEAVRETAFRMAMDSIKRTT